MECAKDKPGVKSEEIKKLKLLELIKTGKMAPGTGGTLLEKDIPTDTLECDDPKWEEWCKSGQASATANTLCEKRKECCGVCLKKPEAVFSPLIRQEFLKKVKPGATMLQEDIPGDKLACDDKRWGDLCKPGSYTSAYLCQLLERCCMPAVCTKEPPGVQSKDIKDRLMTEKGIKPGMTVPAADVPSDILTCADKKWDEWCKNPEDPLCKKRSECCVDCIKNPDGVMSPEISKVQFEARPFGTVPASTAARKILLCDAPEWGPLCNPNNQKYDKDNPLTKLLCPAKERCCPLTVEPAKQPGGLPKPSLDEEWSCVSVDRAGEKGAGKEKLVIKHKNIPLGAGQYLEMEPTCDSAKQTRDALSKTPVFGFAEAANIARLLGEIDVAIAKCCPVQTCPPTAQEKLPNGAPNPCMDAKKRVPIVHFEFGGKKKLNPCCDPQTCMPQVGVCGCCSMDAKGNPTGTFLQGRHASGLVDIFDQNGNMVGKTDCCPGSACRITFTTISEKACVRNKCICDIDSFQITGPPIQRPIPGGFIIHAFQGVPVRDVSDQFYGRNMWGLARPNKAATCNDQVAYDPFVTKKNWKEAVAACNPSPPGVQPCPPWIAALFPKLCGLPVGPGPDVNPTSVPENGHSVVIVDYPPPIEGPTSTTTQTFGNVQQVNVAPPLNNKVACAVAVGPGRISVAPEVQAPAGCTPVMSFSCSGDQLQAGLMVPADVMVTGAYVVKNGRSSPVPVSHTSGPTCGSISLTDIRSNQIANAAPSSYSPEKFTPIVRRERAITHADVDKSLSTEGADIIKIELLEPSDVTVTIDNVDRVLPAPENPSLRLFKPFKVLFAPEYKNGIQVTGKLNVPLYIDRSSVGLYALAGDSWFPILTGREDNSYVAIINDLRPYMTDNQVTFAWMGAHCPTCPSEKLELVYDGGGSVAVVFVHGLTNDRTRFQPVIDRAIVTKAPYKLYTFSYQFDKSVESVAQEFARQLNVNSAEWSRAYIVSHSVGGPLSQLAVNHARNNGYSVAGKVRKLIMAGQPGLGSPIAVYLKLLSWLPTQNSIATLFGTDTPFYSLAVNGLQVNQNPGTEPVVIVGTKELLLTQADFVEANDGVVAGTSAARVHNRDLSAERCSNYFEVYENHLELIWAPGSVWTVWHVIAEDVATPDARVVEVQDVSLGVVDCKQGDVIVLCGERVSQEAAFDATMCKCGNGVCGVGENSDNCPADCPTEYAFLYLCRLSPYVVYPLLVIFLLITSLFSYNAIKRHERSKNLTKLFVIAFVLLGLVGLANLICGVPMVMAYVISGFSIILLILARAHGRPIY
ncbi:MAG: alpha/beta hydrolase [Candidatus Woesearchaeota archaeon]